MAQPSNSPIEDSFSFVRRYVLARGAEEQAGVLAGDNPAKYNPNDPYKLWVIQVVIIIAMSRLCFALMHRMRQPRVVAEILGGILLGPTAMGRIPGFSKAIFPPESIPILNAFATIGLSFFLFFAGLEIDVRLMNKHIKSALMVSVAGLVVPFAFGVVLAVAIYREFIDPSVNFGHFALFVAIAVGITAFPILCRMLVELKLFDTKLGVVVIAAGVGNDIVGWTLLALAVTLVNARNGITILYMVLVCSAYAVFFLYPVRWGFRWLAIRTGSIEKGTPSPVMMTAALVTVLLSSFFTDIIGLHAIFGAFMAGLIIPQDNGLSLAFLHQLEDLIMNIFLPIYFGLSGLKTDLGLLNTGKAWGYTILICIMAFVGKFLGCALAAKHSGFGLREASAIGTLMTCKGLLELIVINLGLQAGILTPIVFAMFVVHALVLTFVITPLAALIIPEKHRLRLVAKMALEEAPVDASEKVLSKEESGSSLDQTDSVHSEKQSVKSAVDLPILEIDRGDEDVEKA